MARSGGKAHLNLLKTNRDQQIPQAQLLLGIHGLNQSLVAVAQIDGAPLGRGLNDAIRPAAVWLGNRLKRAVFAMIKSGVVHSTVLILLPDA